MTSAAARHDVEILKLRNHHLSISVWPQGGRIVDVSSLDSGSKLISWWPHLAGEPSRVGGIGERTVPEGAEPFIWTVDGDSITLSRRLPGGLVLDKVIVLPPDSLSFSISLAVRNESGVRRALVVDQTAAICPGCGGACPGRDSGVSNSYERAFLKRADEPLVEIDYEVSAALRVERDDVEWAAFSDPVSDSLFIAMTPPGHSVVRTRRHWWLDWSREIALKPGATWSGDFRFAATRALAVPVLVNEHFIAGFSGRPVVLFGAEPSSVRVFGLGPRSAGNPVTVAVDGKEFLRAKPLPDCREPLVVALPPRAPGRDLDVEVTIAGKYGQATIPAGEGRGLFERLEAVCAEVERAVTAGEIEDERAGTVLAYRRIATLNSGRAAAELERVLRWALSGATAAAASAHPAAPFYSDREKGDCARLAAAMNLDAEAARLVLVLSSPHDLSRPRLRDDGRTVDLCKALLESALLLSLKHDDEVLALFKARLADLTGLWARSGQLLHEPVQHAHVLALVAPAYKIASAAGVFSLEEHIEAQAMLMDLAAKVYRRAGDKFRLSDWRAVEAAGLAQVGALLPWSAESSAYLSFARDAFYWLLVHGMLADGGFWEMAPQYHLLTLEALWLAGEALLRAGEDCYAGETCHRRLREMCDYLKAIAVVPGRVPAFDDSGRRVCGEAVLSLAKRFQDGELAFHADAAFAAQGRGRGLWEVFVPLATPAPCVPNRGNEVLQGSGKLILRSGCRALTMMLDYGPQGGAHGHHDKMTFEVFWRDVCLIPDAGTYRHEDRLQQSWFRTACAHNTVTLGDSDQQDAQGRLVYYQEGRGLVTAALEARTYEGVSHRREVTMSDRALVIDDFILGAPRGRDLVWRLNSFMPLAVEGGKARFSRGGASVVITPVTAGVRLETAEVPLMGEDAGPGSAYVKGWQLRIHKPAAGDAQRILVRMDFAW